MTYTSRLGYSILSRPFSHRSIGKVRGCRVDTPRPTARGRGEWNSCSDQVGRGGHRSRQAAAEEVIHARDDEHECFEDVI